MSVINVNINNDNVDTKLIDKQVNAGFYDYKLQVDLSEQPININVNQPGAMTPELRDHLNNNHIHITEAERQNWDGKQDEEVAFDFKQYFKDSLI